MNWRKWLYRLPLWWKEAVQRPEAERALDDELAFHVEMQIAANRARGMDLKEARYAALRQFDGLEQRKEPKRGHENGQDEEPVLLQERDSMRHGGQADGEIGDEHDPDA